MLSFVLCILFSPQHGWSRRRLLSSLASLPVPNSAIALEHWFQWFFSLKAQGATLSHLKCRTHNELLHFDQQSASASLRTRVQDLLVHAQHPYLHFGLISWQTAYYPPI